MTTQNIQLYSSLQIAGKMGELHRKIQGIRNGVSRNTIRLAFIEGATTPLREKILEVAASLLQEKEIEVGGTCAAQTSAA